MNTTVLEVGVFLWFFASVILADVISVINKRRRKEANERAEEVVKEINRQFSSRGAKWEYIGDKKNVPGLY